LFIFFAIVEFELRAWFLLGKHFSHISRTFALGIFKIGFFFLSSPDWTIILLLDDRNAPTCPAFPIEMGSCEIFHGGRTRAVNLP
jgi:hypothetical protein